MRDLSSAGRLAAWGTAALEGAVSPDEAAEEIRGPAEATLRVVGLPGEQDAVTLPYALARLRSLGVTGLRLVLPRPGDAAGLPGPAAFNEAAVECGEAVVAVGTAMLGLLPGGRGVWAAHRVEADLRTPVTLRDADRDLTRATAEAAAELARLDVARWDPEAAALVTDRSCSWAAPLPRGAPAEAHRLLDRAIRLAAVVDLARRSDGGSVSTGEMQRRSGVLRSLDTAARRAIEAACSPAVV